MHGYLTLYDAEPVFRELEKLTAKYNPCGRALCWPGVVLHAWGRRVAVLHGHIEGGLDPLEVMCWDDYDEKTAAERKDAGARPSDLRRMKLAREFRDRIKPFQLERVELPGNTDSTDYYRGIGWAR